MSKKKRRRLGAATGSVEAEQSKRPQRGDPPREKKDGWDTHLDNTFKKVGGPWRVASITAGCWAVYTAHNQRICTTTNERLADAISKMPAYLCTLLGCPEKRMDPVSATELEYFEAAQTAMYTLTTECTNE